MRQRLEKVGKTALTVGICTLLAWILVFASSPKRPSAQYSIAISTKNETRYVGEVRAFILHLLKFAMVLSFLAAFGCQFAIGKPGGKHDE
jgi:hypothetical protein